MKNKFFRKSGKNGQAGQSLVELAISLTVILMLLAGAVDFGMAFYTFVAMQDAAQEGALYASFSPYKDTSGNGKYDSGEGVNDTGVLNRVRASSTIPLNFAVAELEGGSPSTIVVKVEATPGPPCEGITSGVANGIKVTIKYDYNLITPLLGGIIGSQKIPLQATVTDTILEPRCTNP